MDKSLLDHILRIRLPVTIFVIIVAFTITYFASRAERDGIGYTPTQPIDFSHALHAGEMQIDCQYCHTGVEKGRHANIPSVSSCMNCHAIAKRDSPQIQRLTRHYEEGIPLEWERIHRVPDFAYFSHSVHVNKGIDCANCHGNVEQMDKVGQVQSFTMGACLDCHREPHKQMPELAGLIQKGPEDCAACHR